MSNDVGGAAVDLDIPAEVINGGIIKLGAGTLRMGAQIKAYQIRKLP